MKMTDIIVVGAGPAGLTAAIYCLFVPVKACWYLKKKTSRTGNYSPKIENYPGFANISGSELADLLVEQALSQGAQLDLEQVTSLKREPDGFVVYTDSGEHKCKAVIIATGAKHRHLNVPGEEKYIGNGISFCAVCDGAFYSGRHVCVIGGGNSALQ